MSAKTEQAMAEIESRIARTRAELGQTLDAVSVELAPRHLVEQGVDMITDFLSANRPDGTGFGAAFRADPVPLALVGLGVAWLVAENIGLIDGAKVWEHQADPGEDTRSAPEAWEPPEPAPDGDGTGHGEGWMGRTAELAQGAWKSIFADSGAVLERAGNYFGKVLPSGGAARRPGSWLKGLERNPLLLGAAGLAAGAIAAMLLPPSRREQEIVAEARHDLWEKAEDLGHRAADGVRALAESSTPSERGD